MFAEAYVSEKAAASALKKCRTYSNWDLDSELRPAVQMWVDAIGSHELSLRLMRSPHILLTTPASYNDVFSYLSSLGIDAKWIQQKEPRILYRKLTDIQSTVSTVQQGLQLEDEQLHAFFRRHFNSLLFAADHVDETLQVVADLLAVPMASLEIQEVVMTCSQRFFPRPPAQLHELGGGQQAVKPALRGGVFGLSEESVKSRAAELKAAFGWTDKELMRKLNYGPRIMLSKASTIAQNIRQLQSHGFTHAQAQCICATEPRLAGLDWTSQVTHDNFSL